MSRYQDLVESDQNGSTGTSTCRTLTCSSATFNQDSEH